MTTITLSLLFIHLLKGTWKDGGGEMKCICEIFLNFTLGQDNSRKSIFLGQTQANPYCFKFPKIRDLKTILRDTSAIVIT